MQQYLLFEPQFPFLQVNQQHFVRAGPGFFAINAFVQGGMPGFEGDDMRLIHVQSPL
jgi:hypothetical protein